MQLIIVSIVLLGLAFAGIAIKILLKKMGSLQGPVVATTQCCKKKERFVVSAELRRKNSVRSLTKVLRSIAVRFLSLRRSSVYPFHPHI